MDKASPTPVFHDTEAPVNESTFLSNDSEDDDDGLEFMDAVEDGHIHPVCYEDFVKSDSFSLPKTSQSSMPDDFVRLNSNHATKKHVHSVVSPESCRTDAIYDPDEDDFRSGYDPDFEIGNYNHVTPRDDGGPSNVDNSLESKGEIRDSCPFNSNLSADMCEVEAIQEDFSGQHISKTDSCQGLIEDNCEGRKVETEYETDVGLNDEDDVDSVSGRNDVATSSCGVPRLRTMSEIHPTPVKSLDCSVFFCWFSKSQHD